MNSTTKSTSSGRHGPLALFGSALTLALVAGFLPGDASAKSGGNDGQEVLQFLASTGADGNGTARARWRDKGDGSLDFSVELEHMDAGSYELYVTDLDLSKGSISVGGTGQGEIEFKAPLDSPKPLFDFEVFDQVVEVRQGATIFFTDTFSANGSGGNGGSGGSGNNSGDKTKTEVYMVNVGPDINAQGKLKYEIKSNKTKFAIEVEKLDAGTYTLLVAGTPVAQITTVSSASVVLEFQNPVEAGKTLLNFDPLGAQIDVELDGTTYLTGVLSGSDTSTGTKAPNKGSQGAKDLGKTKGDELLVFLANSGVQAGASGKAKLTQTGETEFEVEIENVPAGDYPLSVNGTPVGTLSADSTGHAQLNYSTSPRGGVMLLTFEVKGQLIEVKSGADVILSTVFPTSVQSALGKYKKETFKSNKVNVNLINAGADLDATGTLSWKLKGNGEQELQIQVKDLPAGDYGVVVNSVPSTSVLTVSPKPSSGKGKLTFATVAKGSKLLLDFDPVGALVQLTDSSDVVVLQAVIDVP